MLVWSKHKTSCITRLTTDIGDTHIKAMVHESSGLITPSALITKLMLMFVTTIIKPNILDVSNYMEPQEIKVIKQQPPWAEMSYLLIPMSSQHANEPVLVPGSLVTAARATDKTPPGICLTPRPCKWRRFSHTQNILLLIRCCLRPSFMKRNEREGGLSQVSL